MFQFLKNSEAFLVKIAGSGKIPLLSRQVSQISQRAGNAPGVAELPENCQALFVQRLCRREISLISGHISLRVQRPGHSCPFSQHWEYGDPLCLKRARPARAVSLPPECLSIF